MQWVSKQSALALHIHAETIKEKHCKECVSCESPPPVVAMRTLY